jgi:hypothetical protein
MDNTYQNSFFNEPHFHNQYTLSQLRQMAEEGAKKCKCCGGNIRVYKRKLNSGMARVLCWLVANRMGDWTHINKIPAEIDRGHEIGRLSYWGLVERQENFDTSKRSSGVWRATSEGVSFVLHNTEVPSHAFCSVPGHNILGFEDEMVTVHDILRQRFDYKELMRGGDGTTISEDEEWSL